MAHSSDLAALLAPVDLDTFFRDHWEREPLIVRRGDPGFYAGLLSLADVDHLLASHGLAYPSVRLVRDGTPLPLSTYTADVPWGGDAFRRAVLADRVIAHYREGATIILQALHRNWRPLAALCRALEARLAHRVQTNVYLTPKGSRGFNAHYDRHDVFVLQLYGSKRWRVYGSPIELPSTRRRYDAAVTHPGELRHELDLAAGDLLYLPRGWVHEAESTTETSLHVTLGIVCATWADVIGRVLATADEDPRVRRALPAGALNDPRAAAQALEGEFRALLAQVAGRASLAPVLDQLAQRFAASRVPSLEGQLLLVDQPPEVTPATALRKRPGVVSALSATNGRVALVFHGKKVDFPATVRPLLDFVRERDDGDGFRVAELPDVLDEASKVVFARRLLVEGFLVPACRPLSAA